MNEIVSRRDAEIDQGNSFGWFVSFIGLAVMFFSTNQTN
jgi:hypothetical protein